MAEDLVARGDLDPDRRAGIEAMVGLHLKMHGGSAGRSLAAIPVGTSTREALAAIGDPDIERTLCSPSSHTLGPGRDFDVTGSLEPARWADPETTDARRRATAGDVTTDHAPGTAPGDPEATASHDGLGDGWGNGDELLHGTEVRYFGDYEIRRELGRGGMVVPVYEVGEHAGQHYFSMKLVPGGSLVPLMDRYKQDPRAAARLVAEAAEAVAHVHARGILHRDLKPANILVHDQGHPHVTDFGLAKRVEADGELTQSGAILGTPAYMSPEQAGERRGAVTTASDVYGLGAVLYALLTGRAPFGGDSVVETIDAVRNRPPEPPRKLNAAVPRDLETSCLKCLEKDPRRRYPTAQGLAEDLKAWLELRPIAARRVGAAERAWLWCERRPAVAALSAAVATAIVGGTATVIAVQARANAGLRAANTRAEQRYELAVDAIKKFHTGVSEDFLLKEPQFRELRDRLLKSASDFYDKLGALMEGDAEMRSRRALLHANYQVADLSGQVGREEDALALHRRVLAGLEALAAIPGADPATTIDVAQSLLAVDAVLEEAGRTAEALPAYYYSAKSSPNSTEAVR